MSHFKRPLGSPENSEYPENKTPRNLSNSSSALYSLSSTLLNSTVNNIVNSTAIEIDTRYFY